MDRRITAVLSLVATMVLFAVSNLYAGAPPPPPPPPLGIPVDAGAIILLTAGAAVGGKYIYDRSKAKTDDQGE